MDEANLTMEEYIDLEAEKARRHEDDYNEVLIPSNNVVVKQLDNGVDNIDTQCHEFDEDLKTNHYTHRKPSNMEDYLILIEAVIQKHIEPLPPRVERHQCLRYEVEGYTDEIIQDFEERLEMVPSYTSIRDPLRRLCERLIAVSILAPTQAPVAALGPGLCHRGWFTTWTVGRLSQLLDERRITYTRYADFQIPYRRRTRHRTDKANTSTAPQPDP
nr:hypothetical protein [Tanacetum cinerariifolium]